MLVYLFFTFQLFAIICFAFYLRNFKRSIKKAQHKTKLLLQDQEKLLHFLNLSIRKISSDNSLPTLLTSIPFADKMGIVLLVKQITIPSIDAAYNASITLFKNGYILFFRYDTLDKNSTSSHIGCIDLCSDFEPLKETLTRIDTKSAYSEDARCFEHKGRHFLIFNDLTSHIPDRRSMRIAAICPDRKIVEYITPLQTPLPKTEKNWTPFSYKEQLFFLYSISPQKVLELPDPKKNYLTTAAAFAPLPIWPAKWGIPRGGTPAILVDEEYLSLFHSSFKDEMGIIWYVMGAYTFASTPPFQITRISSYPILFQNIYQTTHSSRANPKIRSIYPTGLLYEKRGDREFIFVFCGENDSSIKVITMDKKNLLASLEPIPSKHI